MGNGEEAAKVPDSKLSFLTPSINPKISAATVGGVIASMIIGFAKARWGVDLSGQEPNIMILSMFIVGHYTGGN
jgi:hypothetical protein